MIRGKTTDFVPGKPFRIPGDKPRRPRRPDAKPPGRKPGSGRKGLTVPLEVPANPRALEIRRLFSMKYRGKFES